MSILVEGSVSVFTDNIIVVTFTLDCENPLILAVEKERLEGWLTQMALDEDAPYGTIRRNKSGEVIYGDLK